MRTAFNVPVYVDNDANFAAYGESRMGVAAGKRNFVYISASDGVGAGIVINGEIMHGVTGLAGEIGISRSTAGCHLFVRNRGCLDTVVAENRLVQLLSVTHGNMTLDDLVSFANEGDPGCVASSPTRPCVSVRWRLICASAWIRRSLCSAASWP